MLSDVLPVITSCKKEDANEKRAAGCTGSPLFICGEKRPTVVTWLQSGGKPVYSPARVSLAIFHTDLHTLLGFLPLQGYVILRKKGDFVEREGRQRHARPH